MSRTYAAILTMAALIAPQTGTPAQQENQRSCTTGLVAPPGELAGWSTRIPLTAARDASGLRKATLNIGSAAEITLSSTSEVRYLARPEKPGGSVSYGGLFTFTVAQPGTYRVALGSGAWVDVLNGKKAVTSVAHSPGPECSGIRKMVDFPLTPGRYTLQIAANGEPALPLMIVRLP
jgi:hypothetical protein